MTQRSTRYQVLISLTLAATTSAVEFCNKGLISTHSKFRVESVCKAWDSISISTNFVVFIAELELQSHDTLHNMRLQA